MMEVGKNMRGFAVARALDIYDEAWSVQDSSLAEVNAIWIGADASRALLTQEAVSELIPLLQRFVDTGSIADEIASRKSGEHS